MALRRGKTKDDAQVEDLRRRLRQTRQRLRTVRESRDRLRGYLDRQRAELELLREFTADVFPDVELPPAVLEVVDGVIEKKLTYLSRTSLRSLAACVAELERSGRPGLVVEAGTALGGSAIAMAAAKDPARPMKVYDAFGMIPPPSEKDGSDVVQRYASIAEGRSRGIAGETYYGYREDLLGEVTASFATFGVPVEENAVELVAGLFQDTIDLDEPVALAHVDGDWYESTMTCLERLAPLLVPEGRLVIDDYYTWSGCRTAVDEYFANRPGYRVEYRAKVHVVRLPG